jgi:hypothetical protein
MCRWEMKPKVGNFDKGFVSPLLWLGERGHFSMVIGWLNLSCQNVFRGVCWEIKSCGKIKLPK